MKKFGDLLAGDMRTSKESPSLFLLFFSFHFTSLSVTHVYPQARGNNSAAISVTFTKETQEYIYEKKNTLFTVVKKEPGSCSSAESSWEKLTTSSLTVNKISLCVQQHRLNHISLSVMYVLNIQVKIVFLR